MLCLVGMNSGGKEQGGWILGQKIKKKMKKKTMMFDWSDLEEKRNYGGLKIM